MAMEIGIGMLGGQVLKMANDMYKAKCFTFKNCVATFEKLPEITVVNAEDYPGSFVVRLHHNFWGETYILRYSKTLIELYVERTA
ncbi:MAG: hypothetical protein KAI70_00790 [Candidatus Omnitrophica bacterium]|nr:hypothetical protein [Candidatus Omnitrophota bacterium]